MTILVYKDGRWLIDNEQPLEGVSLDNLAAFLSNPKDGDVVKYDEKSGMWIAGEAGGGSPGGGVLVVNMAYDEEQDKSYTDKTWKEIFDAPMAVIVQEAFFPGGIITKSISLVSQVYHEGGEYSVYFYAYTRTQSGVAISAVQLVTDSENGYLTYDE